MTKPIKYQSRLIADTKQILQETISRLVPEQINRRTKQKFSGLFASWLRWVSQNRINDLLRDPKAQIDGFISPACIALVLDEHCAGKVNRCLRSWPFPRFKRWCRKPL